MTLVKINIDFYMYMGRRRPFLIHDRSVIIIKNIRSETGKKAGRYALCNYADKEGDD